MKRMIILIAMIGLFLFLGCRDAQVVSRNLSYEADMFRIDRRIVFYNGITGEYMLEIIGKCSISTDATYDINNCLEVTCKVGEDEYKKHFLGLSDNVTFFAEQIEPKNVSKYHYKVLFKPSVIIPDIELK